MESKYGARIRDISNRRDIRLDIREDRRDGVASVDVIGSICGGLQGGCAVALRVALF